MRPSLGFIGAGRVGRTLALAAQAAGWRVAAVSNRSAPGAEEFARDVHGCRAVTDPQQVADEAELVFVTVPDDSIGAIARQVRWRARQSVVHCGGATEVSVLDAAAQAGAQTGGFHPLQLIADPQLALRHMRGCSVAIEAPAPLDATLRALATDIGYRVITLPPGSRTLYHAGCCYGANLLLSLLREASDLWATFGVREEEALAALMPLAQGALATAADKGLARAMAGPFSRGDAGVVAAHLRDIAPLGAEHAALYRLVGQHQLRFAQERGMDPAAVERLRQALGAGASGAAG
jgi:predicted short-subunit dehydrogenase-like oxidoreductase (DUF2520 family)